MKPPFRWAGGKSRMLRAITPLLDVPGRPKGWRYFEPFFGAGAVFFDRVHASQAAGAYLSDVNLLTTNFLQAVQREWSAVEDHYHSALAEVVSFEDVKLSLNVALAKGHVPDHQQVDCAARFLLYMRGCFNGIYRVNQGQGQINVAVGDRWPPNKLPDGHLASISRALVGASVRKACFRDMPPTRHGDLVFIDPPYLDTFSAYTREGFTRSDHHDLMALVTKCRESGARVVLCGSNCEASWDVYGVPEKVEGLQRTIGSGSRFATKEAFWAWGP